MWPPFNTWSNKRNFSPAGYHLNEIHECFIWLFNNVESYAFFIMYNTYALIRHGSITSRWNTSGFDDSRAAQQMDMPIDCPCKPPFPFRWPPFFLAHTHQWSRSVCSENQAEQPGAHMAWSRLTINSAISLAGRKLLVFYFTEALPSLGYGAFRSHGENTALCWNCCSPSVPI